MVMMEASFEHQRMSLAYFSCRDSSSNYDDGQVMAALVVVVAAVKWTQPNYRPLTIKNKE